MLKSLLLATLTLALVGTVQARTYNYTCTKDENRYVFTVDETGKRTATLVKRSPTYTLMTFKILKVSPNCAKYGWELNDGAEFCTATQGVGTLEWRGEQYDCDLAN